MINYLKKILRKILKKIPKNKNTNLEVNRNISLFRNVDLKNASIGKYSYVSNNSIVHNTTIGKFCSIGPNCVIGFGNHPVNFVSTSPAFYSSDCTFDIRPLKNLYYGQQNIEIGNDVWIGANVFIKNGIVIGHGAIIGAGAVILNNVPAYAIVVGVPGTIKSYRFTNEIITKLLLLEWWHLSPEIIKENIELFTMDQTLDSIDLISKLK